MPIISGPSASRAASAERGTGRAAEASSASTAAAMIVPSLTFIFLFSFVLQKPLSPHNAK
jgi:hypothetical protein